MVQLIQIMAASGLPPLRTEEPHLVYAAWIISGVIYVSNCSITDWQYEHFARWSRSSAVMGMA